MEQKRDNPGFGRPPGQDWPRALDEPLFLNDVDKSLSTMTFSLARLSPPYGSIQGIVSDHCLDRLEILLETELPSLEHARQMDVQEEMELKAAKSANIFLDHCKAVSASPYPLAVQMNFRPNNQKLFVSNPRTITWFGSADGKEYLGVYEGGLNSVAISGSILSPERGEANMGMIIQNMKNGPYPDLTRSLLLDAEAALISLRLREICLNDWNCA